MKKLVCFIFCSFFIFATGIFAQDSLYLYSVLHGENDKDQFGVVANVGDVNGDGFEDLMVGAPGAPRNLFSSPPRGYVKLYYGGTSVDTIPDMVFNYYGAFTTFGATIVGNGDLNGDGYDDFAIADPTFGSSMEGKVHVFFGGPQLDTITDLVLTLNPGLYFHTKFGSSMTMSGDINGDGYEDLVIGAPFDDWDNHGEVFIYFGNQYMDNIPDVNLINDSRGLRFGYTLDYINDVNSDSLKELLVGSLPVESGKQAFIFWGSKENNVGFQNSYFFIDTSYHSVMALAVRGLGDINGDKYKDFALLTWDSITVCLNPFSEESFTKYYFRRTSDLGSFYKIVGCPDVNGDGLDEIIISTQRTATIPCKIVILYGNFKGSFHKIKIIESADLKVGFGDHVATFTNLFSEKIVSIVVGHLETEMYYDHGTGKVFIYNNKLVTGVANESSVKNIDYCLSQNYPNPFNPTTQIQYILPSSSNVIVTVYNSLGQTVKVFNEGIKEAGNHNITFNGEGLSSGIYLYSVHLVSIDGKQNFTAAKKMLLIR